MTFTEATRQAGLGGKVTATVFQGEYVIVPEQPDMPFKWNPEHPENGQSFFPTPTLLGYDWDVLEVGE